MASAATRLLVCVLRARSLPNLDHDQYYSEGGSDAFAGISVQGADLCISTPVEDRGSPIINKCCEFGLQPADVPITVGIADADLTTHDDLVGTTCVRSGSGLGATTFWAPLHSSTINASAARPCLTRRFLVISLWYTCGAEHPKPSGV